MPDMHPLEIGRVVWVGDSGMPRSGIPRGRFLWHWVTVVMVLKCYHGASVYLLLYRKIRSIEPMWTNTDPVFRKERTTSSILRISSNLFSHNDRVGGAESFHLSGMHALVTFRR